MSKEFLESRILEIQNAINESTVSYKNAHAVLEQVTAHHNALMGRLNETQFLLSELFKAEIKDKPEEQQDASS